MQKAVLLCARVMEGAKDACLMEEVFVPKAYMGGPHFVWHTGEGSDVLCKNAPKVREEGLIFV